MTQKRLPEGVRCPPHNLEAEMSVLGAMLLDKDTIPRVLEEIDIDCFYRDAHRKIFEAIIRLYEEREPADVVMMTEELRKTGDLEKVGGPEYITTLINYIPTTAHLESYMRILLDKSTLRKLISTATIAINQSYDEKVEVRALLDEVEGQFFTLTRQETSREIEPMRQLMKGAMDTIEKLESSDGMVTGLSTGYRDFDALTCGMQHSNLIVIAGRPSMGKTALALGIAEYVALREGKAVGIFSLEMTREEMALRLISSYAKINAQNMRRGFLSNNDRNNLILAAKKLSDAPIYIDDKPSLTNLVLRAKARNMKIRYDIDLLIVDYMQLLQATTGRREGRQQEVSDISRSLKNLARELGIPIIVLSQLNREVENRPDRKPRLSDLRESGAIEQDADIVALMMRPGFYPDLVADDANLVGMAFLNIAKQRNGPTGEIKLRFLEKHTRFEDYTEMREE